jgi:hypothetical protein
VAQQDRQYRQQQVQVLQAQATWRSQQQAAVRPPASATVMLALLVAQRLGSPLRGTDDVCGTLSTLVVACNGTRHTRHLP